jgi:hypothetical protein
MGEGGYVGEKEDKGEISILPEDDCKPLAKVSLLPEDDRKPPAKVDRGKVEDRSSTDTESEGAISQEEEIKATPYWKLVHYTRMRLMYQQTMMTVVPLTLRPF